MNELSFYTSPLGKWAQKIREEFEVRIPMDGFYPREEEMTPHDKFKRAVLKAALIGRNLRYEGTTPVQVRDWGEVLDRDHSYGLLLENQFAIWSDLPTKPLSKSGFI